MSTVSPFTHVCEFIDLLQARPWTFCAPNEPIEPVVSVISSFFNAHQHFEVTYRSVINQTFQNFEWIIVDDGSTDPEAITLLQSLCTRSRKIKLLSHTLNQGLATGRNTAIAHAKGRYLFFMDLDDLIDPTYLEKCVLFLETHPDFSFVNAYSVGFQAQEYWWTHGFDKPARFIEQNWVTGRLLYRQSDFEALGGFDESLRFYEDWERWLRAIVNRQKGWTIPEYLDCYRRSDTGLLATSRHNRTEEQQVTDLIQSRYRHFFEDNPPSNIEISNDRFTSPTHNQLAITNPLKCEINQKRVLCFFPHLEVGGADRFNLDLITLLSARGYEFTIFTTIKSDHPWQPHFYTITPDIFHLPNFLNDCDWLAVTQYIVQSRQIDLIFISNCYIAYYLLPLLRHEFPQVAFVDLTHTIDPGWRGIGYPRLSCQFSHLLDRQVVASQFLATIYQRTSPINLDKLSICYTNIDAEQWQRDHQKRKDVRANLKIPDDTVVLLFPARLIDQKRPLFFIEIVKALIQQTLSLSIIVIGDGTLLPDLKAKVNQLKLKTHVHLLLPVAPTEMLGFYSAADILLLPSAYEGISLSIYEAMAMQLPVVASDVGGQAELVTPGTGFLIPKGEGDEQEVQAYVQVLLPLIQHQSLRQQIGQQARQRICESFSLANMGAQMDDIFQQAIALRFTYSDFKVDLTIAEETLLMALEYLHQQQALINLWQEKCQLEQQQHELAWKKLAMESSKFWQLRSQWFRLKRWLRLTQEKEV
jgi:glycosyltransferase involved in cell wall biosynthesis